MKAFLIFRKHNFLIFSLKRFSYISEKAYSELEAYSESKYIQNPSHIQNTVKRSYLVHLKKFLQSSYISGNITF